jgi:small conductance mechanosensitive channel
VIPNGQLSNDNIINYSAERIRRDEIIFGISYDDNIKEAKDILMNLVMEQEDIEKEPAPQVVVKELAESSVNIGLRFWATNETFWDRHFFTIEEGKRRLEHAGISIPYPQRDLHIIKNQKELEG